MYIRQECKFMQIRIEAKESEMPMLIEKAKQVYNVKSVSDFYRNRKKTGISEYGRVYIVLDNNQ